MAVCTNCGDPGVAPGGHCLLCGHDLDGNLVTDVIAPTLGVKDETISFDDLDQIGAPRTSEQATRPAEPMVSTPPPTAETLSFEDLEPVASNAPPAAAPVGVPVIEPVTEAAPLPVIEPVGGVPVIEPVIEPVAEIPTLDPVTHAGVPVIEPVAPLPVVEPTSVPSEAPIAPAPLELMPDGAHATLKLSAGYEFTSVPADDPPLMGVLLEIQARGDPIVSRAAGPVAHVILALDMSASMNKPHKYPVLRDAIGGMLDDLQADGAASVLVSVVIFAMGAKVLMRDVPAREIAKTELFDLMEEDELAFGRYTDIAGALSRAGRIALDQTRTNPKLPVRIYLLTDGKPQDMDRARGIAAKLERVTTDVHGLAFGDDADVGVLQELMSGKRGGTVKSVRRETIGTAFERVAEVAQKVVATSCKVSVDLAPGVAGGDAFRYRPARVRFPEPAFRGGRLFNTDLGTIEAGRKYQLLLEFRPPEVDEARVTTLGEVTVEIPGERSAIQASLTLRLTRTPEGSLPGDTDPAVRTARDILDALDDADPQAALRALRLRRELYAQERRDPGLLAILDKAIELLETTGSLDTLSPGDLATLQAHTCTD